MKQEQRGLRFPFDARAELFLEGSTEKLTARVIELSFRGCFLETAPLPKGTHRMRIKIWHADQFFEGSAEILYIRATGFAVVFSEMKALSRSVLQTWILAALDSQVKLEHS